jgi:predicted phage baseplate assembly protein
VLNLATPLAYSYDRSSVTIYGNVADATHGQSTGEVLGNGDATRAYPAFALSQSPLTYVSAATAAGAASTLTVRVNELQWHERDDLAETGPRQRVFVTRESEAQKTTVTFGNGVYGARVPTGTANVKASYRYGLGSAGNVAAGQISQLATHPLGAQGVINPLPASGGADPDPIGQARANAPMAVMALDRLVSVRDYADFARTYAGIGKAVAARLSDGVRQVVHVTVAGAGDIPIDTGSDLYANLLTSLQTFGDPYLPVELAVRSVRLLVIAVTIGLKPDYAWDDVVPKVRAAILARFAFDARALGQTAFQSEAVAAAQAVTGVAWLNVTTFGGVPENIEATALATLGATLGKLPYVAAGLATIDPTAAPGSANRIVPAELVFMTPTIPDTLILTNAAG